MKLRTILFIAITALLKTNGKGAPIACIEKAVETDTHSGTLKAAKFCQKKDHDCKCKFSNDGENMQLIINVTNNTCTKESFEFKPTKTNYCGRNTPFVVRFNLNSCALECNKENNCEKIGRKDDVEVKDKKSENYISNFVLNYRFVSCDQDQTTLQTTTSKKTPLITESDIKTTSSGILPTPKTETTSIMIAVFVPITVILFAVIVVLLAITYLRRRNSMLVNETSVNQDISATNGFDVPVETNAFGNLAYETVLEGNQVGEYATINDDTVYYSAVPETEAQPSEPTHTPDTNNYEEVALEGVDDTPGDAPDIDRSVQVVNILYGEHDE